MSLDDIIKANRTRGSKPRAIKKPVGQPRAPLIVSKVRALSGGLAGPLLLGWAVRAVHWAALLLT